MVYFDRIALPEQNHGISSDVRATIKIFDVDFGGSRAFFGAKQSREWCEKGVPTRGTYGGKT